jgi:hypothetical protein
LDIEASAGEYMDVREVVPEDVKFNEMFIINKQ